MLQTLKKGVFFWFWVERDFSPVVPFVASVSGVVAAEMAIERFFSCGTESARAA